MYQSFAYYITLLQKDFARFCGVRLQDMGLSQGLLYFILYTGNHPGCSPREMAAALHMDGGHVARSLSKLEEGGFLRQEQNPRDRRAHILKLTAKGAQAFQVSHDLFLQWDKEVLRGMAAEDRNLLISLLEQISRKKGEIHSIYDQEV